MARPAFGGFSDATSGLLIDFEMAIAGQHWV